MKDWNEADIRKLQAKGLVATSTTQTKDLPNEALFSPVVELSPIERYDTTGRTVLIAQRIPVKPISLNRAYKGRQYKTDAYKEYESLVTSHLAEGHVPFGSYELLLLFGFSNERSDFDNPVKCLTDLLQKKYNFNDKHIQRCVIEKVLVPKGKEFIEFQLNLL